MLELNHINFSYQDTRIFNGLSVNFAPNQCYLITGDSGSGKSTLGLIASGLLVPQSGVVLCDGKKPQYQVSYMFQNPELQFCMETVFDELVFVLENKQVDPKLMDDKIKDALIFCEIESLKYRKLQTLSIGEKQSVSLACIYLLEKNYVILDEPFANIDEKKTSVLLKKLYQLHREKNMTLIFIDHKTSHYSFKFKEIYTIDNKKIEILYDIKQRKLPKLSPIDKPSATIIKFKDFGIEIASRQLFQKINEEITEQSLVAIVGDSGAGKTSLLLALLGIQSYTGKLYYKNKKYKSNKLKLGFVFQNPMDQFIAKTVYDEIYLTCQSDCKTKEILAYLELEKQAYLSPFKLSQGQQRRLALGIILIGDFDLIIMDEPTYGQDEKLTIKIMNKLREAVEKEGKTIIFTSHDLKLVSHYATQTIQVIKNAY